MQTLQTIIVGLVSFGFLITIHELGHFLVARKSGIRISEFSIGFGPTLIAVKRGGVRYKLSLFPVGGYIKMPESDLTDASPGVVFGKASPWARLATLSAGSISNILFGYLIVLLAVFFAVPRELLSAAGHSGFLEVFWYATTFFGDLVVMILEVLRDLVVGVYGISDLSGPVGITGMIGESFSSSFGAYLLLLGMISLNIGIFNLLPLPALDGARCLFLLIEGIRKREVSPALQERIHFAGLVALMGLVVIVTIKDILAIAT